MVITTIGSVPLYMSPICEVVETNFGSMKAGKYFIGNGKAIAFRVIMVALISLVAFIFPYFSDVLSFNILRMLIGSSFTSTWKFYIHSRSNDSPLFDPFDLFLEDSVDPFQDSRWDSDCSVIYNDGCMHYCFSSEITWFNGLVHFFVYLNHFMSPRKQEQYRRGTMRNYPRLQFSIPRDCTLLTLIIEFMCRSLYGFCDSDKCNNQAHNGILMNPGWIKHNITTYLIKMIELQYYTRIPYLKGVQVYVRRDPSILYKVDLKAVADVIIKYGVFYFVFLNSRSFLSTTTYYPCFRTCLTYLLDV